jgi:membrane protein
VTRNRIDHARQHVVGFRLGETRGLGQNGGEVAQRDSPGGRISLRHALVGGIAVGLMWEATQHVLLWYFSTLSVVGVLYSSLATTIVGLLSLEIASIMLLLGAQVIAEYERLQDGDTTAPGELKTEVASAELR